MSSTEVSAPPAAAADRSGTLLIAGRAVVAATFAALVGVLWWLHTPKHLSGHIDIIGYPSFWNFDYGKAFVAYRLLVWEFPLVSALTYWALSRFGPFRTERAAPESKSESKSARTPIVLVDHLISEPDARAPVGILRIIQVLVPAVLVAFAVSARPAIAAVSFSRGGLLAGIAYVAVVGVIAIVVSTHRGHSPVDPRAPARRADHGERDRRVSGRHRRGLFRFSAHGHGHRGRDTTVWLVPALARDRRARVGPRMDRLAPARWTPDRSDRTASAHGWAGTRSPSCCSLRDFRAASAPSRDSTTPPASQVRIC